MFYADIACPWAHVATSRILRAREKLGAQVEIEMRAYPLELINEAPTPKAPLDAEIPLGLQIEPQAGWQQWSAPDHEWPVTTLLALEAVAAANEQSLEIGLQLAMKLRRALFGESRCISMRHVIIDIAHQVPDCDVELLEKDLDRGACRLAIFEHLGHQKSGVVKTSPHLFLPDGTSYANPGISVKWEKTNGSHKHPVIKQNDPTIYEELLEFAKR